MAMESAKKEEARTTDFIDKVEKCMERLRVSAAEEAEIYNLTCYQLNFETDYFEAGDKDALIQNREYLEEAYEDIIERVENARELIEVFKKMQSEIREMIISDILAEKNSLAYHSNFLKDQSFSAERERIASKINTLIGTAAIGATLEEKEMIMKLFVTEY